LPTSASEDNHTVLRALVSPAHLFKRDTPMHEGSWW
jgi:hypothetical protein